MAKTVTFPVTGYDYTANKGKDYNIRDPKNYDNVLGVLPKGDKNNPTIITIHKKHKETKYEIEYNGKRGNIYTSLKLKDAATTAGTEKQEEKKDKVVSSLRGNRFKEFRIEKDKIKIDSFLNQGSYNGYTLLFNFMAGNPYYQGKFIKRESPKFQSGVADYTGMNTISPQRIQTRIASYNEEALDDRGFIHLPLTSSLKSSQTMEYSARALGLTEDLTTALIRGGVDRAFDQWKKEIGVKLDTNAKAQQYQALYNRFANEKLNVVTSAGITSSDISSGISQNPRTYEQYSSAAVREFEFSYKFYPKNEGESKQIKDMIKKFRYHSLAKRGTSSPLRLANPDRVLLRVYWYDTLEEKKEATQLFKFKPCVITKVDAQYGGDDIPSYLPNHAPSEINFTIGLREQEHVYADDVADGY